MWEPSIAVLPVAILSLALALWNSNEDEGWRPCVLRALLGFGLMAVLFTEALGAASLLGKWTLLTAWGCVCLSASTCAYRKCIRFSVGRPNWADTMIAGAVGLIAALVGLTAAASAPNTFDAMGYHMPRIVYWAQAGSVDFYPTQYLNQIMMPPLSEYVMLHTYLLAGSDEWVNLVAWTGMIGSLVGVSLIARELGAGMRGQGLAAIVCATIPSGILQGSGAKNDWWLTLWLVTMVYFALRWRTAGRRLDLVAIGISVGLALMTKGTALLYAPPMLLVALLPIAGGRRRLAVTGGVTVLCVLALNGPHYARNMDLCGSPLGCDSAHGDGRFRFRSERFGPRETASKALRHLSEQLGTGSEAWNQGVYRAVLQAHKWIGADPNDPATTWLWQEYRPPRDTRHEADANNRWHLLLLVCAFLWATRARNLMVLLYYLGPVSGFLLFCVIVNWQQYQARLFLPLFVLGSVPIGLALDQLRPAALQAVVCVLLFNHARPYVFDNWLRPLSGPNSVIRTDVVEEYFADLGQFDRRREYLELAELTISARCRDVGIDTTHFDLEYPYQALVLRRDPKVRFQHIQVKNASSKYHDRGTSAPCFSVCLRCPKDEE